MRWLKWFVLSLTVLSATALAETKSRLVLTGSSTVAPLAMEIGKRFEKLNPGVRVDVQTGGSSRGIADTRSGLADIGMVSRALQKSESDLLAHTIAMDGITLIVNKANPINVLTDEQILAIYTSKLTHWQQTGGTQQAITVVNKAKGRSTLELLFESPQNALTAAYVSGTQGKFHKLFVQSLGVGSSFCSLRIVGH